MIALLIVPGVVILLVLLVLCLSSVAFLRNKKLADLHWTGFVPE
jgi:hypothetical protein